MNVIKVLLIILSFCAAGYGQQTETALKLSLEQAISRALENNPEIKSSSEKISAASGRLWSGVALPSPEVSLEYEFVPAGRSLKSFNERTFAVTQSIEFPSNYFLRRSKYIDERGIAESESDYTKLRVILKVKSAYFNALSKREELDLAKENMEIADDFYKKAEVRYNTGEAANLERLTAKVQYTDALNSFTVKEKELKSAMAELHFSMGSGKENQSENYILTDSLKSDPINIEPEKLINSGYDNNPQLRVYKLKVNTSSLERSLAWSGILPSFNISYFRQQDGSNDNYYGGEVGISVPLWFMFEQKGRIQEAEANKSAAEADLKSARNEFYLNINKAFNNYEIAEKQVRLYEGEIIPQSEEIYRAASKSYEAGEISYLEFLQAKQTVISSKSNYISSLLSYNQSIVELEEAAGKRLK